MTLEALHAAERLSEDGIAAEVVDVRTLKPLDETTILKSVNKTGRLIVADASWRTCGFAAEVMATAAEKAFDSLKCPPQRITLPDCPTPTTPALANEYYPRTIQIMETVKRMLDVDTATTDVEAVGVVPLDVPDKSFTGPF